MKKSLAKEQFIPTPYQSFLKELCTLNIMTILQWWLRMLCCTFLVM